MEFFLFRYLEVETEESPAQSKTSNEIFSIMLQRFIQSLKNYNPNYHKKILAQQMFMKRLLELIHTVATARGDRKKKVWFMGVRVWLWVSVSIHRCQYLFIDVSILFLCSCNWVDHYYVSVFVHANIFSNIRIIRWNFVKFNYFIVVLHIIQESMKIVHFAK